MVRLPDCGIPRLECFDLHSAFLPHPDVRQVSVALPRAYFTEPRRSFPVFYLQDGQNLFDPQTSYIPGRTWRANETADRLEQAGEIEPVILVGVNNTGLRRMAEYTPTRDFRMGGGDGHLYGKLLVEELKPIIDRTYRTLPGAEHTGLGGSSLGGLISLYLGLRHPSVFGRLGVLSPSIWWDHRSIVTFLTPPSALSREVPPRDAGGGLNAGAHLRIWLDIGTAEGLRHVRDTQMLHQMLLRKGWKAGEDVNLLVVPGGVHDENAWAERFDQVLKFLFPPRSAVR